MGFAIGVLALPFLALGWYLAALIVILLNRLLDGLDGALARRRGLTDAGGFLDISLDFFFTRWCLLGLSRRTGAKRPGRRLAVFAFINGNRFLAFLRWRRNIRLIIPVMRINRFIIWAG
ncbi:CDP-alcohol phosphatidyltransferase family protein [Escherichia coli]